MIRFLNVFLPVAVAVYLNENHQNHNQFHTFSHEQTE